MLLLCYQYLQFHFFLSCSVLQSVCSTCHLWDASPPLCWVRSLHSSSLRDEFASGGLLLLKQVTRRSPIGIKNVLQEIRQRGGNGRLAKGRCANQWLKRENRTHSSWCFSKTKQAYRKEDTVWTRGNKCVKTNKQRGFVKNLVDHAKRI